MTTTGASVLVDTLAAVGVRHLFGLPGTQTLAVWDVVRSHPTVDAVFLRNEQDLSLAAKGYVQTGAGLAATVTVPGPGATNMVTGVLDALMDSCPMVLVTTDVPPDHLGKGCVHDCDLAGVFRVTVKAQLTVTSADALGAAVVEAATIARSGRPGPVQLIVSGQMLRAECQPSADAVADGAGFPEPVLADPTEIAAAAAALGRASRPLVYAGGGAAMGGAAAEVVALAERLGAPVVTSLAGRGVIPEDHPLSVGVPFFPGTTELIGQADAVVAIGTRFSEISTATWSFDLPATVVRIDTDPDGLQYNYSASHPLLGEAKATLAALVGALGTDSPHGAPWAEDITRLRKIQEEAVAVKVEAERRLGGRIHPMVLTDALRAELPRDAVITMDGSATEFWLMHPSFPVHSPCGFLLSEVSQELGAALPVAAGAAVAVRDRPVVCVSGDGGLMYNVTELSAIRQQGLDVKVVVFDDGGWYNSVRQFQDAFFDGRYIGTELVNPVWEPLITSFGVGCRVVHDEADLRPSFRWMLDEPGPCVVVVEIDREPIAPRFQVRIEERRASL